jgi:tetratricopeptide (TPR) repeat protein
VKEEEIESNFQEGIACFESGQYDKAIEPFMRALKLKPDYAEAHNNLGAVYHKLRLYEKAIDSYREAIRIKPDFADAYLNIGLVYGMLDQQGLIAYYLHKAGLLYLEQGNRDGALYAYKNLKLTGNEEMERSLYKKIREGS